MICALQCVVHNSGQEDLWIHHEEKHGSEFWNGNNTRLFPAVLLPSSWILADSLNLHTSKSALYRFPVTLSSQCPVLKGGAVSGSPEPLWANS